MEISKTTFFLIDRIIAPVTNTHMSNESHFKPFAREHQMFEMIASGQKHIRIDMEKIKDLVEDDSPEEIAHEIYEAEIASQGSFKPFVKVEKPVLENNQWIVKKHLNDTGSDAYQALKSGILWNSKNNTPDYQGTIEYYRSMLKKGSIDMRYVDLLLETKTDELKDFRAELVYFKLGGQRKGDTIYGKVDAA